MARLKITYFGAFQVTLDGNQISFDTDKARALLAYLALESTHPQRRQRLAGLFWSDSPEERALHNLRQALSILRKALRDVANPIPFLLIQRDSVQFNPDSDTWLDVNVFEQELNAALHHYRHCSDSNHLDCRLNLRQLQRAVQLFRGPFLDQMYLNGSPLFDEWSSLKREAFNQRAIESLATLAELHERRGEYAQARQVANQIVSLAPWDETAQVQVMRLLAVEGQWSAAQTQYRYLRGYLQEQIGVEPADETQALFDVIRRSAAQNTPLPALHQPVRHNLPLNTSPFVGRENELEALAAALADPHCRLLTIHGPGGVGKTRLALQAANEQRGVFAHGVFVFPLASVTDSEIFPSVVAETLDFTFFGNDPPLEQLIRFVEEKHMLWVLDNLEQMLPLQENNLISQVLQHAPGILILATSRQRLNLQEECLFPVAGLTYPEQMDVPSLESLEAVQLFANRAQRVRPHFNLATVADQQAVARICQLLEGLPLGVELAAAALWTQTLAEIVEKLNDSLLRNLASVSVNVSERHRSLWAAFEVSWALLSLEEQQLLARLSVYRGGFELEIAQQAGVAPAALMASLLDKSLLRRDPAGRYEIHEAIRQFGAEKLAGDEAQSASAHASHAQAYAGFLAERVQPLKSTGQVQALAEIALEWENVRQAWGWLVIKQRATESAACAEPIFHFCNIRSRYQEGIDLFAQAISCLEDYPAVLAKALTFQGALAFRMFDNNLCDTALSQALVLYEDLEDPTHLALCLVFFSALAARRKEWERARQFCERALALFEQSEDEWGQSYAWYQLGLIESRIGQVPEAQHSFQASLQAARTNGDLRRQIGPLNLLGDLACQLGAYAEAQNFFKESLALSRTLGDRYNTALALINLGTTFHNTEYLDQAQNYYEESLAILQGIGDLGNQALALSNLGELALVRQQYAQGLDYFQRGLALASKIGDEWAVLICLINLSDAALGGGNIVTARQYLTQALPLAVQSGEPALILRTLLHLGRLYLLQGKTEKAVALLGLVIHHEATYDEHRQVARQILAQSDLIIPIESSVSIESVVLTEFGSG